MGKKILLTALSVSALALSWQSVVPASAMAAYDWTGVAPTIVDGNDYSGSDTREIINGWHVSDDVNHYFRIQLASAPSSSENAELYGIYISTDDHLSGGTGNTDSLHNYVPEGIVGIDFVLDSHYDWNRDIYDQNNPASYDGWYLHDLHTYNPNIGGGIFVKQDLNTHAEDNAFLEWWVPVAEIGSSFEWMAASHDSGPGYDTYDTTDFVSVSQVPLPTSILLLLPGFGLIGVGRRKQKKRRD